MVVVASSAANGTTSGRVRQGEAQADALGRPLELRASDLGVAFDAPQLVCGVEPDDRSAHVDRGGAAATLALADVDRIPDDPGHEPVTAPRGDPHFGAVRSGPVARVDEVTRLARGGLPRHP